VCFSVGINNGHLITATAYLADDFHVLVLKAPAFLYWQVIQIQYCFADQVISRGGELPLIGAVTSNKPASEVLGENRVGDAVNKSLLKY